MSAEFNAGGPGIVTELYLKRIDPLNSATWPRNITDWVQVPFPRGISRGKDVGVADHWHIFHPSMKKHWISYARRKTEADIGQDALVLCLILIDCEDPPNIICQEIIASADFSDRIDFGTKIFPELMPFNDHFIVWIKYNQDSLQSRDGILLGLWDHGTPDRLKGDNVFIPVLYDSLSAQFLIKFNEYFDIGYNRQTISLSNGASASNFRIEDPYSIFALFPDNLDPMVNTNIYYYEITTEGRINHSPLIQTANPILPTPSMSLANYAMPTIVRFSNGIFLITYRVFSPKISAEEGDYGSIERVFTDGVNWSAPERIFSHTASSGANRPHTSVYYDGGDVYLLTAWDQVDGATYSCQLRVEQVTLS